MAQCRSALLCRQLNNKTSPQPSPNLGEGALSLKKERVTISCVSTVKNLTSYRPNVLTTSANPAFTLAEVLITLGIIGVVAALTMPSLIQNHQKKQTVVQLRKVYSDLSNAIKLSEVDNGPMADWDFPPDNLFENTKPFVEKYYLPYFTGAELVEEHEMRKRGYYFPTLATTFLILNNGVILAYNPGIVHGYIWLYADINGMKGPNKVGRDIFVFDAYRNDERYANGTVYRLKFWGHNVNSVDVLKSRDNYACNKNNTDMFKNFYCGRLIELSGWEIPKDYPW